MSDVFGKIVVKRYGTGDERGELCEVVFTINQPVYQLRTPESGELFTWCQSLTRPATPEEQIEYWRRRALAAEGKESAG